MSRVLAGTLVGCVLATSTAAAAEPAQRWRNLPFPPAGAGWEASQFGGDGRVEFDGKTAQLDFGDPLTGVRFTGEAPREGYELRLQARRVDGIDFFCGLTFPVGDSHCSFIVGGWAGSVTGLSNVDGADASDNATTRSRQYENDRWYSIRIRVDDARIRAWVDDDLLVDQPRRGHRFSIRPEMGPSVPLGIAAFQSRAELRRVQMRELGADE